MQTTSYTFFSNSSIEIISPEIKRGHIRYALFDFDGTVSLIREGWQGIMVPMMIDLLMNTPHPGDQASIELAVKEFVTRLTGKQTIYQMIQLCEEIEKRGGSPRPPLEYKRLYNDRLNQHIQDRIADLKAGRASPHEMTVPGSIEWLACLQSRGVICYLASGTDEQYVLEEVELLGLTPYFTEIYGAQDHFKSFSKRMVIERIIKDHNLHGSEFVAFGDGYVEIEDFEGR